MSLSFGGKKEKSTTNQNTTQTYTPDAGYLGMVNGLLGDARGIGNSYEPLTTEKINSFANPYIDEVGGQISSQLGRSRDLQANQLSGQAAAAGAFGGSGWGLLQGENTRSYADAEAQALTGLRASAYDRATQTAQSEEERRMQAAMASIQAQLGGLGLLSNWGTTTGNMAGKTSGTSFGVNGSFKYGG